MQALLSDGKLPESALTWLLCTKEDWRRGSESNRRIEVLQTSALPLGYRAVDNIAGIPRRARDFACGLPLRSRPQTAQLGYRAVSSAQAENLALRRAGDLTGGKILERETGFEPATSTLARSHSTAELLPLDSSIIAKREKQGQTEPVGAFHCGSLSAETIWPSRMCSTRSP